MTDLEAARIIDPATTLEAYAECKYYAGFSGADRWREAVYEACIMGAAALRERIERAEGCAFCKKDARWEIIRPKSGLATQMLVPFCPMCGHKLKGAEE